MEHKFYGTNNIFLGEDYQIVRMLGEGAIGKCFLVIDKKDEYKKVVKVFKDRDLWERIYNKSDIISSVEHRNIEKVYSVKLINGMPCTIMEYLEGQSLCSLLESKDIDLEVCVFILSEMLNALKYLDENRMLHNDIKPSNIFCDFSKRIVKLVDTDFIVLEEYKDAMFVGTLKYAAPEKITHGISDGKSDIYSLGLVMCQLIIGQLPFNTNLKLIPEQIEVSFQCILNMKELSLRSVYQKLFELVLNMVKYNNFDRISIDKAIESIIDIKDLIKNNNVDLRDKLGIYDYTLSSDYQNNYNSETMLGLTVAKFKKTSKYSINDELKVGSNCRNHENEESTEYINISMPTILKRSRKTKGSLVHEESNSRTPYYGQLEKEYEEILIQAKITFNLWRYAIILIFTLVIVAVLLLVNGMYLQGALLTILNAFVVAIQKLFTIREDHYRKLIENKMGHLELGDLLEYILDKLQENDVKADTEKVMDLIKVIKENNK